MKISGLIIYETMRFLSNEGSSFVRVYRKLEYFPSLILPHTHTKENGNSYF